MRQDGLGNQFAVLGYFADVQVLASPRVEGLPRSDRADALAQFRWAPVAVTPGETLYLRVNSTVLGLGTHGGVEAYAPTNVLSVFTLGDPINAKRTVANGGFYTGVSQGSYDLVFRTYADVSPVPEAHAPALALALTDAGAGAGGWCDIPESPSLRLKQAVVIWGVCLAQAKVRPYILYSQTANKRTVHGPQQSPTHFTPSRPGGVASAFFGDPGPPDLRGLVCRVVSHGF
jgi:hypothetical protein